MLHALRQSAHRTGRLLLPLLLLSWLSLVCGHCVVLAGGFDAEVLAHHEEVEAGHDCCPEVEVDPCQGGDCEHTVDVQPAPASAKTGDQQYNPMVLAGPLFEAPATRAMALPAQPPNPPPAPDAPLYLRNCTFLI